MNTLSNEELIEIISGIVDGVQPTTQEMVMARELLALRKEREAAVPAYYLNQIDYGDGEGFELKAYFRELDAMKSKDDFGGVVIPAYVTPPAQRVTPPDEHYKQLSELYHAQEKRLFKLAQRIKGPTFDKYAYCPSQAIDVLEASLFGEVKGDEACRAAMLKQPASIQASNGEGAGTEIKQPSSNYPG